MGFWVQTGSKFAYAVGRPTSDKVKECVGKSLAEAADSLLGPDGQAERLLLVGTYVAVAGEIDSSGNWCILYSTNPELVGCELVGSGTNGPLRCSTLQNVVSNEELKAGSILEQVILGATTTDGGGDAIRRRWKVAEVDGLTNLQYVT
jgi:hypothetical protein